MLLVKNIKIKKTHILVAVYVTLIVIELFFCVPYQSIQIFRTKQNVPHTEIIGSGYAAMFEISDDDARITGDNYSSSGKIVNTSQIFINVSITSALAIAIYFLLQKNEAIEEMPVIDTNILAFGTDEEVEQAKRDYARKMYEYVKRKEK